MPGMTDYSAENWLNYLACRGGNPLLLTSIYLGLFTTPPSSDSGTTGATEVSGSSYARVQVAGQLTAGASWTTSATSITLGAAAPSWLTALGSGVNIYDVTNNQQIGTVQSISGTTVTLQSAAAHASQGGADTLQFSAFGAASASSGSEPGVTPASIANNAAITFPQATASWATVEAFGLFDAAIGGNLLAWDYLGAYAWQPCFITAALPAAFECHAHGFASGATIVFTAKYGGTVPSFSQGNLTGALIVGSPTADTFNVQNGSTAVNTSSSGNGAVRQIVQQPIAINVTASFAANNLTLFQA